MLSRLVKRDPLWRTAQQTLSKQRTHTKVPLLTALGTALIHTHITYIHCYMSLTTPPWWTYLNSEYLPTQTPSTLNQIRHAELNTPSYTTDVLQTHSPVPSSCHNEGYRQQQRPSVRQHWIIHQPQETQNCTIKSPQKVLATNAPTISFTLIVSGNTFSILIIVEGFLLVHACGRRGRRDKVET